MRLNFKFVYLIFVVVVTCGALVISTDDISNELEDEHQKLQKFDYSAFEFPKLFDFDSFKRKFNKHYDSLSEEMRRKKIFLSRLLRSLVSNVSYKLKKGSYFLRINQMSDLTPKELGEFIGDDRIIEVTQVPNSEQLIKLEMNKEIDKNLHSRQKRSLPVSTKIQTVKVNYRSMIKKEPIKTDIIQVPIKEITWNAVVSMDLDPSLAVKRPPGNSDAIFIDHRQSHCLGKPKSQGKCGSCYAFAVMALLEWLHCKETGQKLVFSEQYMIDCAKPQQELDLKGCAGGNYFHALNFVHTFGLQLSSNYPYLRREDSCPYNTQDVKQLGQFKISERIRRSLLVPFEYMEVFLQFAPLLVNVFTGGDFYEYGGGVHTGPDCRPLEVLPDPDNVGDPKVSSHAMLLVGSGRQDGQEYWLMRNSHSKSWGEGGYYKLSKKTNCLRYNFVMNLGSEIPFRNLGLYENKDHNLEVIKRKKDLNLFSKIQLIFHPYN